jgi:hypothetical protein
MNCYGDLKSLVNFAEERDVNQITKATWYIYNKCTTIGTMNKTRPINYVFNHYV